MTKDAIVLWRRSIRIFLPYVWHPVLWQIPKFRKKGWGVTSQ